MKEKISLLKQVLLFAIYMTADEFKSIVNRINEAHFDPDGIHQFELV